MSADIPYDEFFHPLSFFNGGVSPGEIFETQLIVLKRIVDNSEEEIADDLIIPDGAPEVSLISLVSAFESFLKDQFAAVGNVCPTTLIAFSKRRPDFAVALVDIIEIGPTLSRRLGSVIADTIDFGTPRSINSLYFDLLAFTPFCTDDSRQYAELLNDRNLLVHHGGIYTLRYQRQRRECLPPGNEAFWDGLMITKAVYFKHASFLTCLVKKILSATNDHLIKAAADPNSKLEAYHFDAIDYLISHNPFRDTD